jgi:hypothetical protein
VDDRTRPGPGQSERHLDRDCQRTSSDHTLYTFNYDRDGRRIYTYFNTVAGNATWTTRTVTSYDRSGRDTLRTMSSCHRSIGSGRSQAM